MSHVILSPQYSSVAMMYKIVVVQATSGYQPRVLHTYTKVTKACLAREGGRKQSHLFQPSRAD